MSIRSHIDMISEAAGPAAPEVGALFTYQGHTYAVVGWMRDESHPGDLSKGGKLVACEKDDASWVIGKGETGPVVAPVSTIEVTGDADWTPEQYDTVLRATQGTIQRRTTLTRPTDY